MSKNLWTRLFPSLAEDSTDSDFTPLRHEVYEAYNSFRPEGKKPIFCYVPFNNMSFSFKGRVLACAYNQKVELGRFPEQTVRQMWFESEMGQQLREHMRHNDLSFGCKHCKYFVEHGKFSGLKPLVFDRYHDHGAVHYPQVMEFELSNTCNFECVMCNGEVSSSVRKNRDRMPPFKGVYDDSFVDQLEEFIPHLKEAKFYGGEPLLIPIYYKIWDRMLSLNPDIRIFTITNGSVLNDRVKDLLERGNFDLAVSMDSLNKERLESIRLNMDKEQTLGNIGYFNNYCQRKGKNLVISFTMMRINWMDFPDMVRFCNSINAALYVSYLKTPPQFAIWNLPANEIRDIRLSLEGQTFPQGNYAERNNARCFKDLIAYLTTAEKDSEGRPEEELIPLAATEGISYLDLAFGKHAHTSSEPTPGLGDAPEALPSAQPTSGTYRKEVDYRSRLAAELEGKGMGAEEFFDKLEGVMAQLPNEADRNLVFHSILGSPLKEVMENVREMSEQELLEKMAEVTRGKV